MSGKVKVWMPLMIGDYLADTQHLTTCEHGAYLLLIMHQWRMGHMRADDLPQIARMTADAWSIARARLMHMLKIDSDGLYYSPKCDRIKAESVGKQERAHEKAQKAANARWDRVRAKRENGDAPSIAHAMPFIGSASTPPPLSANAPSGGGSATAAGAASPPPPGDAPSMPARSSSKHRGTAHRKSEARAKRSGMERKPALAASMRAQGTVRAKSVSRRRDGAQQDTLHSLVMEGSTGAGDGADGNRFQAFRNILLRFYSQVNGDPSAESAWGIKSTQALRSLLERDPDLTEHDLVACLGHRVDAIRICMQHPPKRGVISARDTIANVVNQLHYFKHHPSDAFGRPLG